jgi:prepilin-type N-terminal cleavage/methylation domain-containing protein
MTRPSGRTGDARGFTIIELLFVVTVLGILASIAVPRYNRYLIRADAAELASRVNAIELGVREAEAMDGRLPAPGRPGVVPPDLQRFLTDSLFRAPVGVTISYLLIDGRPFGLDRRIPAALLIGTTGRANEALDAMAGIYPRAVMRTAGAMAIPFEGTVGPGGSGASGSGTPPSTSGQPATGQSTTPPPATGSPSTSPPSTSPPSANPPSANPPSTNPPATGNQPPASGQSPSSGGALPPSYTPPPTDCFSMGLPPGQARQCASGGGNSAWFRDQDHGNAGGAGHDHNHGH